MSLRGAQKGDAAISLYKNEIASLALAFARKREVAMTLWLKRLKILMKQLLEMINRPKRLNRLKRQTHDALSHFQPIQCFKPLKPFRVRLLGFR